MTNILKETQQAQIRHTVEMTTATSRRVPNAYRIYTEKLHWKRSEVEEAGTRTKGFGIKKK